MLRQQVPAVFLPALLLIAPITARAQNTEPKQQGLECRSYCAALADGGATLYASWPSLQDPDVRFRLYLSSGPEALKKEPDRLVIEMARRAPKMQKPEGKLKKLPKAGANWTAKSKQIPAAGSFTKVKIGRVDEFASPRGRNRADYAIAIDGLNPWTSYYLLLVGVGAKAAAPLEAYCVVTTCPGHDEGDDE